MATEVIDLNAQLDMQDVSNMYRQMDRAQKIFGLTVEKSLHFAAWSVARSLGATTKVSPKKRDIFEVPGSKGPDGLKTFEGLRPTKRGWETFRFRARGKREANKDKRCVIRYRGLAKSAWLALANAWGARPPGPRVNGQVRQRARLRTKTTKQKRQGDLSIKLENSVRYATDAFKSGGTQTINNVMERVGRQMEKVMTQKLVREFNR